MRRFVIDLEGRDLSTRENRLPSRLSAVPDLFISSRIVSRLVDCAGERGLDGDALCRAAGIDPADVRDIDAHIDVSSYLRLWHGLVETVGDPALPLAVAASWSKGHNLLRFVCMSSPTLGEGIERAGRYLRVITNAVSWPLERGPQVSILAMERHTEGHSRETQYADEFGVAEIVTLARAFTGTEWRPIEVRFAFPEPKDTTALREFFRAPILFSQPRTEIHIATSALGLPMLKADPAIVAFFDPYMDKLLLRAERSPRRATDDVKDVLAKNLRGSVPTLEEVAAALNVSGRTLRRRLKSEGSSFQSLVDETRFACAKNHIAAGQLSLSTIAFLLGFSEPSAFHRAFRRWAGMTPQAFARTSRASHAVS